MPKILNLVYFSTLLNRCVHLVLVAWLGVKGELSQPTRDSVRGLHRFTPLRLDPSGPVKSMCSLPTAATLALPPLPVRRHRGNLPTPNTATAAPSQTEAAPMSGQFLPDAQVGPGGLGVAALLPPRQSGLSRWRSGPGAKLTSYSE